MNKGFSSEWEESLPPSDFLISPKGRVEGVSSRSGIRHFAVIKMHVNFIWNPQKGSELFLNFIVDGIGRCLWD